MSLEVRKQFKMCLFGDFPVGPAVKNPPSNTGDAGSIPGGRTNIQHAAGQLSPLATTTELAHPNERAHALWSLCATARERKPAHYNYREAQAPQVEKPECRNKENVHHNEKILPASTKIPCAATKTRHSHKKIRINIFLKVLVWTE